MHPAYQKAQNHATAAAELLQDLAQAIKDADAGLRSDSDLEMITSEIENHLTAATAGLGTPSNETPEQAELRRATEEHSNALVEYSHATNQLSKAKTEHSRATTHLNNAHRRLYAARQAAPLQPQEEHAE